MAARAARGGFEQFLRKSNSSPTSSCLRLSAFAKGFAGESAEISRTMRPRTLTRFNQPEQFQTANRIADGTAADLQHLGELTLCGKFVAGFQFFDDQTLDLLGNFLIDLVPANDFEVRFDAGGQRGTPSGLVNVPAREGSITPFSGFRNTYFIGRSDCKSRSGIGR